MGTGPSARTASALFVIVCCAIFAARGPERPRTRMVTELVSVMHVRTRPMADNVKALAATPPPAEQLASSAPAVLPLTVAPPLARPEVVTVDALREERVPANTANPPARHAKLARPGTPEIEYVAVRRPQPAASHRCHTERCRAHAKSPAAVAQRTEERPSLPAMFLPIRRLGFSLKQRLVRAGVVPACSGECARERGPEGYRVSEG